MTTKEDKYSSESETRAHILLVRNLINFIVIELLNRGEQHDLSKLQDAESLLFAEYTKKLKDLTYGSEEYQKSLDGLKPALIHHYAKNSHHPEHFADGIDDMNLVDIVEMFCDWAASCQRHDDGNLRKSLDINQKRFRISNQLTKILQNTIPIVERK
jgi:hypothetical protein